MSSEKDAIKVSTASWVTAADQLRLATHVVAPSAATRNVNHDHFMCQLLTAETGRQ